MSKIKILLLTEPASYGAGSETISLMNNIDRSRFDISMAANAGSPLEKEAARAGVEFHTVELPKMIRTRYLKTLLQMQRTESYDIVHSNGNIAGYYGRTMKKHMPAIKTVHTFSSIYYSGESNFFSRNISKTIEQYLTQFTDKLICHTNHDLMLALSNRVALKESSVVIRNGINLTEFSNLKPNEELRKKLGLSNEHFIIGNISNFSEHKNQKLIIHAAYYLVRKFPEMRFILAGSGETLRSMQEYAREAGLDDQIIFTGEITNTADYYSIFDVFVLPSFWESMPQVLLEAMAARNAIVCSDIANLNEVVKNNYSALTIDPHDMDDLFTKVSILYKNKELREKLSQNAMIESTGYDESEVAKLIENVYTGVMEN